MNKLLLLLGISILHAAEIQVDLTQAGKKVSPRLFGLFIEEINHGIDGGLYAELVRNGSFVEAPTLDAWGPVRNGAARLNLFFDDTTPLNSVKTRSLRVEASSPGGEKVGVSNEGFWGIAVKPGTTYEFSTYARAAGEFRGPLTVSLEAADGTIYGQTQITGLKPTWSRLMGTIQSVGTNPAARLVISTDRSATYWLNMVSLRPGRDVFRADLLQKLKDLKPAFLRFPGGTYVQGNERETAFRWKTTIGDLENRRGHFAAPWVYSSSDNMGYHEYLLLSERLGAEPMYVAYGGMTWTPSSKSPFGVLQRHRINVSDYPLDQMGPIVQEALDAIEYANGAETSTWGALRAKAGHPKPFGLKYVEVGNEDGANPLYREKYMLFYNAIKAKYPDIQIIANARRGANEPMPMDFVDEHTYTRPMTAIDMGNRLDKRDRSGPKAVLAEYAVQTSAGFGNMRAALAEAVMLSGIERNSDVMPMISYAPLLANVNAINWRPNLIYFDSGSSYGTPPYYVQRMFADSLLDSVVPVQVTAENLRVRMDGDVNPQGFGAEAEFQGAKVTGSAHDYIYSLRARKVRGDGGLSIRFAVQDQGASYLTWLLGVRHRASTLHVWGGGGMQDVPAHILESSFAGALASQVTGTLETGRWYDVRIRVEGRRVRCYLDDKEIHNAEVPEHLGPSVHASAGRTKAGEVVLRLVNTTPFNQNITVNLTGAGASGQAAVATVLSSPNLDDENSLKEPTRVAPVEQRLPSVGPNFQYDLQGNSFTVIKIGGARN